MASASRVSSLKIFERMKYLYTEFCNLDIQHVLRAQRAVSCASLVCWMKKFFCETVVFGRKILFHPAGSLSFSYCLLSLLAWSASTRFLWLKTAAGQPGLGSHAIGSVTTQKNRKRVPRCLDLSPIMQNKCQELRFLTSACSQRRA